MGNANSGRRKITRDDLPSDWAEKATELYEEGAGDVEIYAMLDISERTFARLLREDSVFLRTIKRGRRRCEAWWQEVGRKAVKGGKDFNAVVWMMNMSNRYRWLRNPDLAQMPKDDLKAQKNARETVKLLTSITSDGISISRPADKGK